MPKYESLVGMAGILGLISFSTLIQKIYETHNTATLPWKWVIINISAQLLSFTYGVANGAYGIFIPNFLFISGLCYIFYVKLNHKQYEKEKPKQL